MCGLSAEKAFVEQESICHHRRWTDWHSRSWVKAHKVSQLGVLKEPQSLRPPSLYVGVHGSNHNEQVFF